MQIEGKEEDLNQRIKILQTRETPEEPVPLTQLNVDNADIAAVISEKTGIPVDKVCI